MVINRWLTRFYRRHWSLKLHMLEAVALSGLICTGLTPTEGVGLSYGRTMSVSSSTSQRELAQDLGSCLPTRRGLTRTPTPAAGSPLFTRYDHGRFIEERKAWAARGVQDHAVNGLVGGWS